MFRLMLFLISSCLGDLNILSAMGQNVPRQVDIVLFSYNRPMQLYACLESVEKYLSEFNEIHVIYRASNPAYAAGYEIVWQRFSCVKPHLQGKNPEKDFKPLVVSSVYSITSRATYVMFGVDDDIVTDYVSLDDCVNNLEKYHGWGFFLGLGNNINNCYHGNYSIHRPIGCDHPEGIFTWEFIPEPWNGYWSLSCSVDMAIYRKAELVSFLKEASYVNPNTFEDTWQCSRGSDSLRMGVCYTHSKLIDIPMNLVSETHPNRHGKLYSTQLLLEKFQKGLKIDISQFYKIKSFSQHQEYELRFIPR